MTRVRARELSPLTVRGVIRDSVNDAIVPGSLVTMCIVRLWDLETGNKSTSPNTAIINNRLDEDILDEVIISEEGAFQWTLASEDNPIVTNRRQMERHRATLHFEWSGTSPEVDGEFNSEFEIEVENLYKVGI